jgi:PIN domain nuclease of toxin-antitoxin system
MRLLLDTHTFLWWLADDPAISEKARAAIADGRNECFVSLASCWELAIKSSLGKLRLTQPVERFIPEEMSANGFHLLGIDFRHAARIETLPFYHRDPFDRLLTAQALVEKMTIVSCDTILSEYGVKRIW